MMTASCPCKRSQPVVNVFVPVVDSVHMHVCVRGCRYNNKHKDEWTVSSNDAEHVDYYVRQLLCSYAVCSIG